MAVRRTPPPSWSPAPSPTRLDPPCPTSACLFGPPSATASPVPTFAEALAAVGRKAALRTDEYTYLFDVTRGDDDKIKVHAFVDDRTHPDEIGEVTAADDRTRCQSLSFTSRKNMECGINRPGKRIKLLIENPRSPTVPKIFPAADNPQAVPDPTARLYKWVFFFSPRLPKGGLATITVKCDFTS